MATNFLGHEKEPKTLNGPKARGKHPLVHSHSAQPKRKIITGKRMSKKAF